VVQKRTDPGDGVWRWRRGFRLPPLFPHSEIQLLRLLLLFEPRYLPLLDAGTRWGQWQLPKLPLLKPLLLELLAVEFLLPALPFRRGQALLSAEGLLLTGLQIERLFLVVPLQLVIAGRPLPLRQGGGDQAAARRQGGEQSKASGH